MLAKINLKNKAIKLREEGKTYSEILEKIPVAKSTLSLWLREVGLSKPQKQRITRKSIAARLKGARRKREQRIKLTKNIYDKAEKEIGKISDRELWLIGTVLYWAEGAKEKSHKPGSGIQFSNSDDRMIKLFLDWLRLYGINKSDIFFKLYIHENHKNRINEVIKYWVEKTGFPQKSIVYVYFKKHNPKTKRYNVGVEYHGNLVVLVRQSSIIVRKVEGWVRGITKK